MKKSQALLDNFSSISDVDKPTINNLSNREEEERESQAKEEEEERAEEGWGQGGQQRHGC